MEARKGALMTPLGLALPYLGGHLTLDTDACSVLVSCVPM